jgi:PQQ-dependent catabolism-associated beta-propeller protein
MRVAPYLLALLLALPAQADRLFVTNERDGTLQVIDTQTDRVTATVKIGNRPRGMAVAPDGKRLYVAVSWWRDNKHPRSGRERIVALDPATLKTVRDYPAGTDPECVAVALNGQRLYLSNEDAGTASIVDVKSGAVRATLVVGTEPEGVTASPDGKWVYVTAESSNVLTVIDAAKEQIAANILVDARPRAVIFTRDGRHAWASAELGGSVMLIDARRHTVLRRIRLEKTHKPVSLALSPDQSRLYVALGRGNAVAIIDTKAMRLLATVPAGNRVWGLAVTRDGKKVYAANSLANTISVIDTHTLKTIRTIPTGDGPWALAVQ